MAIDVSAFSADLGPLDEERRTINLVRLGQTRLTVVSISGEMMDLGWEHRLAGSILETTAHFAAGTIANLSAAFHGFVSILRAILTHGERVYRWWCSVEAVALEFTDS
jgi:hypothetical protein